MTSVSLVGVSKVFQNGTRVLDGLDLRIDRRTARVARSVRLWKSTILRLIAGLEAETEGRILFDDEDTTDVPTRDRNVAMVA
jgi:ABC-type sugar transport system ATPase subunit